MTLRPELLVLNIDGDLRRGGWQVNAQVNGDTDLVSQGLNWLIEGKSLAEATDLDWRTVIDNFITSNPNFSFNRYSSQARVQAGTVDNFLMGESLQSISFAVVASPANSHEATSWRFSEMVEHILQQHCNYIYDPTGAAGSPNGVASLELDSDSTNFTTNGFYYIVHKSDNMWSSLQRIGGGEEGGGEFFRPYCRRDGTIVYEQAPPFKSPQPTSKGTLTKDHIRGTVQVTFHNSNPGQRVGQVQISVVASPTVTYNAKYPASPQPGKIIQKTSGIFASSQARANVLAERLYRWLTRSYTLQVEVDAGLALFGDDGDGLELGNKLLVTYDGPAESVTTGHGVHLDLDAQSMFVYGVDARYDAANRSGTAILTLEHDNS